MGGNFLAERLLMIGEPSADELFSHCFATRRTLHISEKLGVNLSFRITLTFELPEGRRTEIAEGVVWSVFVI